LLNTELCVAIAVMLFRPRGTLFKVFRCCES